MENDEYINPKKTLARREADAGLSDPKKGRDMGDVDGPAKDMFSQAKFSGYTANGPKKGPPAAMLKKRDSKE